MNKTPIEWTDFTVNPFRFRNLETGKVGHHFTKISPGCKNCYAGEMQGGPYLSGLTYIEENKAKGEFFLDEAVLQQVLRRKKPARIFWCDMTDMFLEDYPDEWIDRCFAVMALTPHLTHQVLTKRAERMRDFWRDDGANQYRIGWAARELSKSASPFRLPSEEIFDARSVALGYPWKLHAWPLPNVWLGVSVEDQQRADERIPLLLQTPAAVRFLSVEPLLGSVDLFGMLGPDSECTRYPRMGGIDWAIVGGESGPGARPCDLAWIRSITAQCNAAGVPRFVKQLGAAWAKAGMDIDDHLPALNSKGGNPEEWPADLRVRQMPEAR